MQHFILHYFQTPIDSTYSYKDICKKKIHEIGECTVSGACQNELQLLPWNKIMHLGFHSVMLTVYLSDERNIRWWHRPIMTREDTISLNIWTWKCGWRLKIMMTATERECKWRFIYMEIRGIFHIFYISFWIFFQPQIILSKSLQYK